MNTRIVLFAALLPGIWVAPAFAGASGPEKPAVRVSVQFVNPQDFTDLKRENWQDYSPGLMDQLQNYMVRTGERFVPKGMHLSIKVTDVDLAGRFEPWRGPEFDDVRIVRAIDPPRINLEYRLTDDGGRMVKSGRANLTDLGFEMRIAWPLNDYLRYEKSLLSDWFYQEFAGLRKG